jgi:hypothetical protein
LDNLQNLFDKGNSCQQHFRGFLFIFPALALVRNVLVNNITKNSKYIFIE